MKGWISLNREIQKHWLWSDKPFSKGQAWIDMLLLANHQDNKFVLGSQIVQVKRGEFITSELKLAERWGWSKTKVRSFLKLLENDSMIVKKSDKKKTTVTIVNYSFYQDSQTTEEPQKNHKKTTEEPQKNTNNNVNNENNENNEDKKKPSKPKKVFSDDSYEMRASVYLFENNVLVINPNKKKPNYQVWCAHIDKLKRVDGYSEEQIAKVIEWVINDSFWKSNILSASKLRDKFDTLYAQMSTKKKQVPNNKQWIEEANEWLAESE